MEICLQKSKNKLTSYEVIDALSSNIPENAKIVTGSSVYVLKFFILILETDLDKEYSLTTGLGAMGYGLPALLGTCAKYFKEKVFLYESDGSLMMNLQELQTLQTYNFNATIFCDE